MASVELTCSNLPRPSLHKAGKGHQWWRKDTFHVADAGKTLCGVDATGWLSIEARETQEALADPHLCVRCARKLQLEQGAAKS